ncbi:hypothetical protein D3Z51_03485 [Clostridiaceae bacterium]|nr:hypothetical protein [Clostridiaceae bacterium]RKI16849.1 hypothetical protein D7V81_03765 [bacterium 1XD21-70]
MIMGLFKTQIMGFMEEHPQYEYIFDDIEDDEEPDLEQFNFSFDIWNTLQHCKDKEPDKLVQDFIYDLFPVLKGNECIWAMASVGALTYNFSFEDIDTAVKGLYVLAKENVNLYFSPAIFCGWRKDKNVRHINTIYIDIDDVEGIDFSIMSQEEIEQYLLDTFHLIPEMLPNWLVTSGHGLHLYYLIETLNLKKQNDSELRLKYTDYLITRFKADIACRNKSRILRFPYSRNVKHIDDVKTTRLFHMNLSEDRTIERLNYFAYSQYEMDTYMEECKARRAEKRRQTMIANGTYRRKKTVLKVTKKKESPKIKKSIIKITKDSHLWIASHPELKCSFKPLSSKARYRKIVRDLHNWAAIRNGVPKGYRAIFTHILTVYMKRMFISEEDTIICASHYVDEDFMEEAKAIIQCIYASNTEYMYRNEHIAELLDFTEEDLKNSFANYTEGQRKEARKRAVDSYDNKRLGAKRTESQQKKIERYNYIKEHPEQTANELSKILKCSIRTIKYERAKIRQEKN